MKKVILICIVLFFSGLNGLMAQFAKVNPIPTYNYYMTEETAAFQEMGPENQTEENRDMNVEVTTSSSDASDIFATVWIMKKNGSKVLGPYTVYANELLSVEIDGSKWCTIITCTWDVTVSVWIDKIEPRTLNDILPDNPHPAIPPQLLLPVI